MKSFVHSLSKKSVATAFAIGYAALALACVSSPPVPKLTARAGANQQVIFEDGAEKIVSMRPGSIVSIRMADPMGNRSTFVVGVANQSGSTIVIAPEMVSVTQLGRSLRVFSYEEVADLEQKAAEGARMRQMALGFASGLSTVAGGMAGVDLSPLQQTLQATQRQVMNVAAAGMEKAAATHELNLKELGATALKKNTLFPQQGGGGVVYTEQRGQGPIHVRVQVALDVHEFDFAL